MPFSVTLTPVLSMPEFWQKVPPTIWGDLCKFLNSSSRFWYACRQSQDRRAYKQPQILSRIFISPLMIKQKYGEDSPEYAGVRSLFREMLSNAQNVLQKGFDGKWDIQTFPSCSQYCSLCTNESDTYIPGLKLIQSLHLARRSSHWLDNFSRFRSSSCVWWLHSRLESIINLRWQVKQVPSNSVDENNFKIIMLKSWRCMVAKICRIVALDWSS